MHPHIDTSKHSSQHHNKQTSTPGEAHSTGTVTVATKNSYKFLEAINSMIFKLSSGASF